jgi:CheY-like chemotaxis protein
MRIVIADDQKDFAFFMANLLRDLQHDVLAVVTTGGFEVIHAYERHQPDIVLMDLRMPRLNGATICRHILSKHPDAKIVVMSGDIDHLEVQRTAAGAGAVGVINKPFTEPELIALLDTVEAQLEREQEGRRVDEQREHEFSATSITKQATAEGVCHV